MTPIFGQPIIGQPTILTILILSNQRQYQPLLLLFSDINKSCQYNTLIGICNSKLLSCLSDINNFQQFKAKKYMQFNILRSAVFNCEVLLKQCNLLFEKKKKVTHNTFILFSEMSAFESSMKA